MKSSKSGPGGAEKQPGHFFQELLPLVPQTLRHKLLKTRERRHRDDLIKAKLLETTLCWRENSKTGCSAEMEMWQKRSYC